LPIETALPSNFKEDEPNLKHLGMTLATVKNRNIDGGYFASMVDSYFFFAYAGLKRKLVKILR
jgi:hypothetical protein